MPAIKGCPSCALHDPCEDHFRSSDDRDIRFCQCCQHEVYVDKNLCTICDTEFSGENTDDDRPGPGDGYEDQGD